MKSLYHYRYNRDEAIELFKILDEIGRKVTLTSDEVQVPSSYPKIVHGFPWFGYRMKQENYLSARQRYIVKEELPGEVSAEVRF